MPSFGDLENPESLKNLDTYLADSSYITENATSPSEDDFEMFNTVSKHSIMILRQYPNVARWTKTLLSSSAVQLSQNSKTECCPSEALRKAEGDMQDIHNRPKQAEKKEQKKRLPVPQNMKKLDPAPKYLAERLEIWDELREKYSTNLKSKQDLDIDINITLPDGKVIPGKAWTTTPKDIALGISKGLAKACIVSKIEFIDENGQKQKQLWDMTRPFENTCNLQLLKFDNDEAKEVFWHSSAHVIGEAMEQYIGGKLVFGPPLDDGGFYYDIDSDYSIGEQDFSKVEGVVKAITKENQPFERLIVSKVDLLKMFAYNPYKQRVLNEKVTTEYTSAYRCGTLIDLCRGPHLSATGQIGAFKCTQTSTAYHEGRADAETLTRLYGISFPDKKQLKQWELFQAQAKERNHRKIGKEQELFFFHPQSPGCCFWYPKGAFIFNQLQTFMREEYRKRGFKEVITPNMFDSELWKTSGHWQHYADDMFQLKDSDKKTFALKPMNCPSHCLIFGSKSRSFKELPIRMADFGVLHRNELAGALTGLSRVRRFQQDDAHIFCRPCQIKDEMKQCLDFLHFVIKETIGMEYQLFLSTRPEGFLGELSVWDDAENQLKEALTEAGHEFEIDEGGGAFYGPKIDIKVTDALNRRHQTATVQLDFNLPNRFDLLYVDQDGSKKRPVIIHRAILGSLERQMSIITENFGGKWPLWLSPRMVKVISVGKNFNNYAQQVCDKLYAAGLEAEFDADAGLTLNKQIRNAQLEQFNFQFIIGAKEEENNSVNIRTRNNKQFGEHSVEFVMKRLVELKETRVIDAEEQFLPEHMRPKEEPKEVKKDGKKEGKKEVKK